MNQPSLRASSPISDFASFTSAQPRSSVGPVFAYPDLIVSGSVSENGDDHNEGEGLSEVEAQEANDTGSVGEASGTNASQGADDSDSDVSMASV